MMLRSFASFPQFSIILVLLLESQSLDPSPDALCAVVEAALMWSGRGVDLGSVPVESLT